MQCMPGFLKLLCQFASVCLPLRLVITSGVIWTRYNLLNRFCSFYMATIVGIASGRGISIDVCYRKE